MKALYCLNCGDMRGLLVDAMRHPVPVSCDCGLCHARWTDPFRGVAIYAEDRPDTVRVLGIHNEVLAREPNYLAWKDSPTYMFFHKQSMIVCVRPGETSDTRYTGKGEIYGEASPAA